MLKLVGILMLASAAIASDVLEFKDATFEQEIKKHETILVEFFAPWCGHCKKLAPEYETAATTLKRNDPPVPLAKVDCTENEKTCKKFDVSGYPTLKVFKNGEFSKEYDGPREANGIVSTMKKAAGPTSKELTTVEEFKKYLDKAEEYVVVGFFVDAESKFATSFKKVADSFDKVKFAHTTTKAVLDHAKYSDNIILYQPKNYQSKFEESVKKFDDDATVYKIKSWLEINVVGLCAHRTRDNADLLGKPLVVAYYEVDYVKNVKGTNYWRNRVMKVGKKFQEAGKAVNFAVSSSQDFSYELQECGMTAGDKPVVCARDASDRKYVMADEFSMENLEKFVNDLLDDKLEPYLKSEPVPEDNDQPVKVAVAKNFDSLVNDDTKDVLIEFYAPWCGHCKSLEPKYNELAETLKDEPEIAIVKMDATANDVPKPYEVSGFPTLYFKPMGSPNSPRKYSGAREVQDFIKYLAENSTNKLKGYDRKGKKTKKGKKQEL